jgi:amino acid transporter
MGSATLDGREGDLRRTVPRGGAWSRGPAVIAGLRRTLLGRPLPTSASADERLTRPRAMGAFGLDALSSVAYGPDEILYVLILAGSAGTRYDLPIAVAIAALLAIVALSYRQTIHAYPRGGGSYTVARENLGVQFGLVAAAALMVDYLTTVAVSVTAGVEAIIAFVPALDAHRVVAGVSVIALLVLVNLRGVREAGAAFVLPTYVFIGSLAALLLVAAANVAMHGAPHVHSTPRAVEGVSILLVLRAFAGGCTAMTGVEAIANGVPAFRKPEPDNAAATLMSLALILGALFLGVAGLGAVIHAVPSDQSNVVAQIGQTFAGGSPLYYLVQISLATILVLAANTSFNGFPRLAAIMAEDDWFPHQFSHRGMRLAYSNGIIGIAILATLLVVAFGGRTHALIPLFAVGVFLCFTLSQAGMVRHWLTQRGRGWHGRMIVNGIGAVVTGTVTIIVVATKFAGGAWIVLILVPLLVAGFHAVHRHYSRARQELAISHIPPLEHHHQHVLVPVAVMNRATAAALAYAGSISQDVTAVHFCVDEELSREFQRRWERWAPGVTLELVPSPFREVVVPLVELVEERQRDHPHELVTVVIPEVVPHRLWEEPLHNQMGLAIKLALLRRPGVVVTSVSVQLRA